MGQNDNALMAIVNEVEIKKVIITSADALPRVGWGVRVSQQCRQNGLPMGTA
jgi:hypothetical protein